MKFNNLNQCVSFLAQEKELIRIREPVDPHLDMAEITRRVFDAGGPALLFENVNGSPFPALSNLYGTWQRTLKIFEPQLEQVKALVDMTSDPMQAVRSLGRGFKAGMALARSLPLPVQKNRTLTQMTRIDQLPQITCWPGDGGAFLLLPQVFSLDPDSDSVLKSNLGMYRIQLSGNDYPPNEEIGLHYQLHRGIGVHHQKALEKNRPLKVSIFIGGPPAHALAAVMPLPEGMPEIAFAGALAGRNFRYFRHNGFVLSTDADFCITGWVMPHQTRPEGPFGDHLGYYSNVHEFPCIRVASVWHRPGAIFPFTVVGRPPREDSHFGRLIHEITRNAVAKALPGVTAVNAVDAAGVHPLLLAKARERYLPYDAPMPRELLTHAHAILGKGQLSLAKYLFICAHEDDPGLDVNDEKQFLMHVLERVDFSRDLHFVTCTTMDTLDYSGQQINQGSKLVMAAAGPVKRRLGPTLPVQFSLPDGFSHAVMAAPGIAVIQGLAFTSYPRARQQISPVKKYLETLGDASGLALVVVVDDARFCADTFDNFLWVTFLRSNPSHDIYGIKERTLHKHWGCQAPLVIDARIKPFHAALLEPDPEVALRVDRMACKGGPLFKIL
ncbi:UbiD family decarboxylase [Desulfotignum balticum]|uniref:UbiD family decarboxylase n=1 Tax=Desulfotignum balticum TaxID=115781 RepID=UPI00040ADD2F|nr:UbiD family decarboxylase [Desulfotignum balticum]